MKSTRVSIIILTAVIALTLFSCSGSDDTVLAKVGTLEIKASDYMERLQKVRKKLSLPDNGEVRRNFLNSCIDEKLMLVESAKLGFDHDEDALEKLNTIKLQRLLDLYLEKEVYDPVVVSDDDLKKHFAKMNIKLRVRHLYADNKKTADSLYNLVTEGVSFDELAREIFKDPRLKETGGDLGYMGLDEMQMDFADSAYSLEVGDISRPVKTNYGYSIIRVDDRLGNPFLTENEFLNQKSAIVRSYNEYIKKKTAKDHAAGLQSAVEINPVVFNQLYREFKPRLTSDDMIEPVSHTTTVSDDALLLTSDLGQWDVKTFKEKAQYTSADQRQWIKNKEFFEEFILGLVTREQIVKRAKDKGLDKLDIYTKSVEKDFNMYQIDRLKTEVLEAMQTPEDSLAAFYQANKNNFMEPGKANLREIALDDPAMVNKVKQLLARGSSFSTVAREYSINRHTAIFGGEMGYISYNQFGPYLEMVKNLKAGQWTGPLKRGSVYFFWQSIDQRQARLKTFDEVKEEVIAKYKSIHFNKALQDKIEDIRSYTSVSTYPEKLKTLKYN